VNNFLDYSDRELEIKVLVSQVVNANLLTSSLESD